ncbi:MAG TPA: hypothetical protein VN633_01465 [Bryobacteraceae bacterium]|nr:hypothetical protein [Bryobacteraceae bacterium]
MRGSAFALAVFLGAGLTAFAQVDQGLLNLVPSGTRVVAGIRVDQGKVSPFGQFLLQRAAQQDNHFQKLLDETGFDPRRDLQQVLFASTGEHPQPGMHQHVIVLARGVFDPQRIKDTAVAKGGHVENYRGVDIISGKAQDNGGVAFLDDTLAVMGDRATIRSLIQNRNAPAPLDPQLQQRMQIASTGNEAWFASVVPGTEIPPQAKFGPDGQSINGAVLQGITETSGAVHSAANGLNLNFDAVTRSEKDAQSLSDVIRFFAGMVQMQAQNQPQAALLLPSLDSMRLTTAGNETHVSLSISEATVEQLLSERNAK